MGRIHIGTSGFSYPFWKGRFYPEKLPASQWLNYYSGRFNSLELNNTFYRFPVEKQLKKAAESTPQDFSFSVKMHRIVTHYRRMKDVRDKINEFMAIVNKGISGKLACVLYQLPPSYVYSDERLNDILLSVDPQPDNVIEFRHVSWWNEKVYEQFRKHHISFCSTSFPGLPGEDIVTSNVFYKRMHGIPELFQSPYTDKDLKILSKKIPSIPSVFVYFNNTMYEAGYTNAATLARLISG